MTHRGPFQPLLFCDSVIRDDLLSWSSTCHRSAGRVALALPTLGW